MSTAVVALLALLLMEVVELALWSLEPLDGHHQLGSRAEVAAVPAAQLLAERVVPAVHPALPAALPAALPLSGPPLQAASGI